MSLDTFSPCCCLFPQHNKHTIKSLPLYFLCSVMYTTSPLKERKWQREIIYNKDVLRPERKKKKEPFLVIGWADQEGCLIGRDWRELILNNIIDRSLQKHFLISCSLNQPFKLLKMLSRFGNFKVSSSVWADSTLYQLKTTTKEIPFSLHSFVSLFPFSFPFCTQ